MTGLPGIVIVQRVIHRYPLTTSAVLHASVNFELHGSAACAPQIVFVERQAIVMSDLLIH